MKTIIVPTDFTPAADNAMHYAAQLARQMEADVLLTHMYQVPISMNDMPVAMISIEEIKANTDEALKRCRQELRAAYPTVAIRTESRLGDINYEMAALCTEVEPFAIVVGTQDTSGIERLLFGSVTLSLMRHTDFPVIAVPYAFKNFSLRKIALAADLQQPEKIPVHKITGVVQGLNAQLHIVHVQSKEEIAPSEQQNILLNSLHHLQPIYHTIQAGHVKEGLVHYIQQSNADLLLIFPHEHGLMDRLFSKSHTEDLVSHAIIPVMTIKT